METKEREAPGRVMNLKVILQSSDCARKRKFAGLGILEADEIRDYRVNLMQLHGEHFGKPDAPELIKMYIAQHMKPDWSLCSIQHDLKVEEEMAYHGRLSSFFVGMDPVARNFSWYVTLEQPYLFGEIPVATVYGHVTAVVREKDDSYTGYILRGGVPVYSMRAMKPETRPEYAPELIGAYLGLKSLYPGIRIRLVHLRHKDDQPDDAFNPKKQILEADLNGVPEKELFERLQKGLDKENKEPDCTYCSYQALCKGVVLPELSEEEETEPESLPMPIFTEAQQEVVDFLEGACAVYAVPGAGKTTTLVHRLCKLLKLHEVDPKAVLFVTFTNKAADEIQSRVMTLLGTSKETETPDIFTYNGLGWQIIRDHPELVGNCRLLTPLDEKRLLLECLDRMKPLKGFSYRMLEGRFGLLSQIRKSFAELEKDEGKEVSRLALKGRDPEQVKQLKKLFEQKKRERSYITYDEQISIAVEILSHHPDILHAYAKRWQYLMIDEFQDSSQENVDLLYLLAKAGTGNLVVVGDTDQSIYEWRNGSPKHLMEFHKHFPDAKEIYMSDNFRSVRKILEASNTLISQNGNRIGLHIIAHKESEALPYRVPNCSVKQVPTILKMLKQKHFRYGDIAVLCRNNAPLEKLKALLEKSGIETISPSDYLIQDPVFLIVKDILDLYLEGFGGKDGAFYRYLVSQKVEIPAKEAKEKTFYENLLDCHLLKTVDTHSMDSMLEYATEQERDDALYLAVKKLFRIFLLYDTNLSAKEALERTAELLEVPIEHPAMKAILELISFQMLTNIRELQEYMGWMQEFSDDTKIEYDVSPEKVNLMTAHSSKGKEFPAVIILQLEDFKTSEDERRLLYVAMTRAKKVLFLLESPYHHCEMLDEIKNQVYIASLA